MKHRMWSASALGLLVAAGLALTGLNAGCAKKVAPKIERDAKAVTQNETGASPSGARAEVAPPAESKLLPPAEPPAAGTSSHPDLKVKPDPTKLSAAIQRPNSGGWGKTPLAPLALARRIDSGLHGLAGVQADSRVHEVLPIGEGEISLACKWADPRHFEVQYVNIEGDPPHTAIRTVRANDGQFVLLRSLQGEGDTAREWGTPVPLRPSGAVDGKRALAMWPSQMPRLALSWYTQGKDVYAPLVQALLAPNSGYHVVAEQREAPYRGHLVKNYRLYASRTPAAAAKLGASNLEIVVDGERYLPETMTTRYGKAGSRVTMIDWDTRWGPGHFTPADFPLPARRGA